MSTSKRVFFYIVSLVGLGIAAAGIGNLLSLLFDIVVAPDASAVGEAAFNRDQFSFGIAMLIIGGLLWFFFWRNIQKQASSTNVEAASGVRKAYLNVILLASAITALATAMDFIKWLLVGVPLISFSPDTIAAMIVASGIWYYHWRIEANEGQPSTTAKTLRRWYVYIMCTWGLCWFTFAIVHFVNSAVLFLPVWGSTISSGLFWNEGVCMSVASILIGGFTWIFHWFIVAKDDFSSVLRNVYLYLLTIFGGSVAGLVALTAFVYEILRFFISGPDAADGRYFQFLGWTVPTIVVAGAVWLYHQQKAQEEASRGDMQYFSARRVLFYLMSFIGLGTLVAGLLMLFGILVDAWINTISAGTVIAAPGWWHSQLALSLAMLIVSIPVWYFYWNRVMRLVESGGLDESRSRSRRIYFYVILGSTIIALAAALVNIFYQMINGFLDAGIDVTVLRHVKWSLQALVSTAPVLIYHLIILRHDQSRGAETVVQQKNVIILADSQNDEPVKRLEKVLGYRIRRMNASDDADKTYQTMHTDADIDAIADAVNRASAKKVIIIVDDRAAKVIPYEDD